MNRKLAHTARLGLAAALIVGLATYQPTQSRAQQRGAPIIVVVNAKSPVYDLSSSDLRRLFENSRISRRGVRLIPLNLPRSSRLRTSFDRAVLGKSPSEVSRFWNDARIRGGTEPKQARKERLALITAAKFKTVVTYARSQRLPSSVRAITVDGKSPGDPAYPLRMK